MTHIPAAPLLRRTSVWLVCVLAPCLLCSCETKVVNARGIGASSSHPVTERSDQSSWSDFLGTEADNSSN